jgi:DNA-binding NarL/FixJ family response regulator
MSIRLLIADDHQVVREGLVGLLAGTQIEVVAQATTGEEAVRLVNEKKPDVALLDVRMPEGDGLVALSRIKMDNPEMPVLMFSNYDNPNYAARAVALGAEGYLLKGCSREELLQAIEDASMGKDCWSREKLRKITGALGTPQRKGDLEVNLTKRELEVLRLLSDGATNKDIAEKLHISPETVKEHVKHILSKIGVTDRTQAAVWAVRNSVI